QCEAFSKLVENLVHLKRSWEMLRQKRSREKLSISHDDLAAALATEGIEPHLVTTSKAAKIAEKHGLVTQEFRDNAYTLALHKEIQRALKDSPQPEQLPLFDLTVTERGEDGT